MNTCVIIGAGLSGLVAGNILQNAGWSVTVIDKAHGVGGRMATRRLAGGVFDHGAQYFTVRNARFVTMVEGWVADGIARIWARGFLTGDGEWSGLGEPRYVGVGGMTGIPKHLAQNLDVRLQTCASAVELLRGQWQIHVEDGETLSADALLLTAPVPQSLEPLNQGGTRLPDDIQAVLESIDYDPCFAVMAALNGPSGIPQPGGMWLDDEPIRWIADNMQKGVSPNRHGITIHAGANFTREHWDTEPDRIAELLIAAAGDKVGAQVEAVSVQRWRYSQPIITYPDPTLCLNTPGLLAFAGDAFAGPRVEGAALSGMAAAESLLKSSKKE